MSISFDIARSLSTTSDEELSMILQAPGFGVHFTDHMIAIAWDKDNGWHDAQVRAYGPLLLDPAAAVLHYGQEISKESKHIAMLMVRSGRSARTPTLAACSVRPND